MLIVVVIGAVFLGSGSVRTTRSAPARLPGDRGHRRGHPGPDGDSSRRQSARPCRNTTWWPTRRRSSTRPRECRDLGRSNRATTGCAPRSRPPSVERLPDPAEPGRQVGDPRVASSTTSGTSRPMRSPTAFFSLISKATWWTSTVIRAASPRTSSKSGRATRRPVRCPCRLGRARSTRWAPTIRRLEG